MTLSHQTQTEYRDPYSQEKYINNKHTFWDHFFFRKIHGKEQLRIEVFFLGINNKRSQYLFFGLNQGYLRNKIVRSETVLSSIATIFFILDTVYNRLKNKGTVIFILRSVCMVRSFQVAEIQ